VAPSAKVETIEERAHKIELKQKEEANKRKESERDSHNKLVDNIIRWIKEEKGEDIVNVDVSAKCNWTNNFIIATGTTSRHIRSIAVNILENVGHNYEIEGNRDDPWQAIDLGSAVVHIFDKESRSFYNLQGVWEKSLTLEERNKQEKLEDLDKDDDEDEDEDEDGGAKLQDVKQEV